MGRLQFSKHFWLNLGSGILLGIATIAITLIYTGQEHNFHWWIDWYNRTLEVVGAWENSPSAAWQVIEDSLGSDRNQLYTIPLAPFLLIFGKSREVYQIALALVYLFPFSLIMGWLTSHLISQNKDKVFWLATLITLLTPVTWISTFLGIPDTGAAAFIGLALVLYVQELEISSLSPHHSSFSFNLFSKIRGKVNWKAFVSFVFQQVYNLLRHWRLPLIGVAIAMAIMLRRHFAYGGVALLGAIGLQALVDSALLARKNKWLAIGSLVIKSLQIFVIVDNCLFTLKKIVPEFTNQAITNNYKNLYTSWSLPILTITQHYIELLGIIPWLLVIAGLATTQFNPQFMTKNVTRKINIVVFYGAISLGIWLFRLRYGNVFYFLHIIPLVVVGISLLIANIYTRFRSRWRTFLVSVIISFLMVNLMMGFTDTGNLYQQLRSLFALGIPPIVRTDYNEVVRLIKYLRAIAAHQEPIYVVGHQRLYLSPSLINSGEIFLYGYEKQLLNVLSSPQADSQDYYPLEQLLQAEFVVLPSNLGEYLGDFANFPANGEWLPPKEYDVVKVVFYAFVQNWLISEDFKELPTQFQFQGDTSVKIYQRTRPTSLQNAIKTLTAIQEEIPELPGAQLLWISLSDWLNSTTIISDSTNHYTLAAFSTQDTQPWTRSFLYLFPPSGKIKITGNLNFYYSFCQNVSFSVKVFDRQGKVISSTNPQEFNQATNWEFFLDNNLLDISSRNKQKSYLILETLPRYRNSKTVHSCGFWLNDVEVSSTSPSRK